jgi:hypothetical protein
MVVGMTTDAMKIGEIYGRLEGAVVDLEKDVTEDELITESDIALQMQGGALALRNVLQEIKTHFGHTYAPDGKIAGKPCSVCGLEEDSSMHSLDEQSEARTST